MTLQTLTQSALVCNMNRKTTQQFIISAVKKHGTVYDYSKVVYVGALSKVQIICRQHGSFLMRPNNHLQGKGCTACGKIRWVKGRQLGLKDFITRAKAIHLDAYDYSSVVYNNIDSPVKILCNTCGTINLQTPNNHLHGKGCFTCYGNKKDTIKSFIEKSHKTHLSTYDYSQVTYINSITKVKIVCKTHGTFSQKPRDHIAGTGCPKCAISGFNKNKPATLYYLSINGGLAYKIGITNRSVRARYSLEEMDIIEVLFEKYFSCGGDCYDAEQSILKEFSYAKYKGDPLLKSGNSELFDRDILTVC